MAKTFLGGIHIDECKYTKDSPIKDMPAPEYVEIPLLQHIGANVTPTVQVGDHVDIGDVIGRNDEALSCPIHASISGTIERIEKRNSYRGEGKTEFIIIKSDGLSTLSKNIRPLERKITELTPDEIIAKVREAGISGLGGATFPAYAKLSSAVGKAERLIINCAECEPYLTANHRLMLECPDGIIYGAKIVMLTLGIKRATFAVEDNKRDAAKIISEELKDNDLFEVELLKTKYPQGDERQLIFALTGTEIPTGKLPADVGCVVFNAETCFAMYNAVINGMPLVSRVVTVAGDCVANPQNLRIPIGTGYKDVLEFCGGLKKQPDKFICGGPMMGNAAWDLGHAVIKGTSGILAMTNKQKYEPNYACIRCGRCVNVCPMHLMPLYLARSSEKHEYEKCKAQNVMSCMECGSCSYICPGKVPIVEYIRNAKSAIRAKKI